MSGKYTTLLAAALGALALTGCDQRDESPAEQAADAVEESGEAAGDAADDTADAIRDSADEANGTAQ